MCPQRAGPCQSPQFPGQIAGCAADGTSMPTLLCRQKNGKKGARHSCAHLRPRPAGPHGHLGASEL